MAVFLISGTFIKKCAIRELTTVGGRGDARSPMNVPYASMPLGVPP